MALYCAKADGRNGWRFFEPDMDTKAKARRRLEVDLRNALADEAFELHYQPITNLKTGRIAACEALLRWPHAERGMISPAEFIPVAEEMGLIVEIGNYVLRKACLEATTWPDEVCVAVNLSAIQFRRGSVVVAVRDAIRSSGLPASRLQVEITESVLIHDTDATRVMLSQLRDLGVTISLDDFGTGFSSLSYLHSFPFHKIKIDRSFVQGIARNERSRRLLHGVSRLSAELGLTVVVEGVETDEQLTLIRNDAHIDEAQGFLLCRPMPARQIRDLLNAGAMRAAKVA
jgi:EAL domain-containing protein (putative c-di-GMP-specific phosphodiesterase class I)